MITFDLICKAGAHRFEGWFGSSAEFDQQKFDGLLSCPICGDAEVQKAAMAPNLGRKGNQSAVEAPRSDRDDVVAVANMSEMPAQMVEMIGKLAEMQTEILKKSDWVGDRFADEARAIHYGDSPERIIHGSATVEVARELHDEGIDISPLPMPFVPPEAKN
jgi:hypothetical protein